MVNGDLVEKVTCFDYLGCIMSFDEDLDIKHKVIMCGRIRRNLRNKARIENQLNLFKIMASSSIVYACET